MALMYTPPDAFGLVERGLYRTGPIHPTNFLFLRSLNLRTILLLSTDTVSKSLQAFCDETGAVTLPLGVQTWRPNIGWRPVSEELVKEGLEAMLNVNNHPMMVICATGLHDTGTLIGCLRKMQGWNFNSTIVEYRSYTGGQGRCINEQFIELFDTDLVTLPRSLPPWFLLQQKILEEERDRSQTRRSSAESHRPSESSSSARSLVVDTPQTPSNSIAPR
ncbi:tyrosine phosphatase family-domain-containing protein [Geranomyces variabilis]|nr:tyrosine phosphatase family-domain-containing protein [Geranomyces variabilis]KAJ3136934.1 hypothetical protein HDU90_002500 [Geranomyces variabilis]